MANGKRSAQFHVDLRTGSSLSTEAPRHPLNKSALVELVTDDLIFLFPFLPQSLLHRLVIEI